MALPPPTKIVLKSTTRLSLNERFSAYRKQAENTVVEMRQRMQQTRQQNSKNWRLIQQFENRPSVIAALKLKKKSLKQRLGQAPRKNVKDRLSLGIARSGRLGVRSPRFRGGLRGRINRRGKLRSRVSVLAARNNQLGTDAWSSSESPRLQGRVGQNNIGNNFAGNGIRNRLGRGVEFRRGRGGARSTRGAFRGRGQSFSQKFRNVNSNRSRGGSTRGGRGKPKSVPSRQTLDNELDEYMSRTKGNLDLELDSYMAQTQFE